MEVIHPRCAGIDVSKKDAKVCVRVQGRGRKATSSTVTTWTSMTGSILALREHLIAERVTCVVIESTAAYWKPFYFLLDDALNVVLVNARHVRNVPGRKTDVSDAAWLAELGAHGLVRASFVPPEPIRVLRDLTRARTTIAQARTKEIRRLETLLEDTGIKLSSVACEITGVSGRAMLEALIAGQRDPAVLADLAKRQLRKKIPALTEALQGRFNDHHAFMVQLYLDRIDAHEADVDLPRCPHRGSDRPVSGDPQTPDKHPGLVTDHRQRVHRRNRRRHERVPHRRAPGVVGGGRARL